MQRKKILATEQINRIIAREEGGIFGFFIKHWRFTYLILIAVILFGTFALVTLPREAEPEVQIPIAVVTTPYPGASPNDVEELVTNKIESAIRNVANLKTYSSTSGVGFSNITVEFLAEANIDDSVQKLRDAVDTAKPDLPDDANDPRVTEIRLTDMPIITYSLLGQGIGELELRDYAETLATEFEGIAGVSEVDVLGGAKREFRVVVNQTKLAGFHLTLGQIVQAISAGNVNFPVGSIDVDGFSYNVRVEGKDIDSAGLRSIVVAHRDNTPILLSDVALVADTTQKRTTISRLGIDGDDPLPTVSLQIRKATGGNILDIIDESRATIDRLQANETLPPEVSIVKTNDNSVFIRQDLETLGSSALQTGIAIVIILLVALGWRASFITGLSVPIAFLMAFVVLYAGDMTLNSMVLFSLVLSLGLMVDNSIVIMEGISEYMEKYGLSAYQAAILSVWNYRWPVISGTLTTVSAFAPMFLVSGIMGEYLSILPKTIIATLLSSLFVALVVIPTIASRWLKQAPHVHDDAKKQPHWFDRIIARLHDMYGRRLHTIVISKAKRRLTLATAWTLFVLAVAMPVVGLMRVEMFPKIDLDYFIVNIEMPVGTVLEDTQATAARVEAMVKDIPELENYVTSVGRSGAVGLEGASSGSHLATITVNVTPTDERERTSYAIADALRERAKAITTATVRVEELSAGPPTGAPIEVRISGDNLDTLAQAAKTLRDILENMPHVINVTDNLETAAGDFTFTVNRERANYYGLSTQSIAATLRNAVYGATASNVLINGEEIDIVVRYPEADFQSVSDLRELTIVTPQGTVPIKEVADVHLEPALLAINHKDGDKVISITADVTEGTDLAATLTAFNQKRNEKAMPDDVAVRIGGETEDIQQSYTETFTSMIAAVILIAFILVLQFNSFKQPFIIIFTIPLAIIGVIFGLMVMRQPFSFPVFIGIVSLAGIAVNDAIVLIDKINKNLAAGLDFEEAIVDGGLTRMQPIFLTSLTTIAGVLPLYFASELWRGLSLAVAFGLAFSTILTLVIIPIMYYGLTKNDWEKKQFTDR